MVTLSLLVASLATVGNNGAPDHTASTPYDNTFHFATASLYPSDEALPAPAAEAEQSLPIPEDRVPMIQGEAYYTQGYESIYMQGSDAACRCRYPGFYAGGEATVLRPFISGACIDPPCFLSENDRITKTLPNYSTCAAPRLWLGYTSCDGLGCRVRWWRMDLNASGPADFLLDEGFRTKEFVGELQSSLDVETIDFELTDIAYVGSKWELMLSGGVRYASFNFSRSADGTLNTTYPNPSPPPAYEDRISNREMDFEGMGGTAAIELRRPWFHRVGLFANARGSLLYGKVAGSTYEEVVRNDVVASAVSLEGNTGGKVRSVWEAQLGVDYTKELWQGLYLTTRVAGEAQYWNSMISESDVGFVGMTFSVGLIR